MTYDMVVYCLIKNFTYIFPKDNPELFAMMEKTRMYIFRNLDPEVSKLIYFTDRCSFAQLYSKVEERFKFIERFDNGIVFANAHFRELREAIDQKKH